MKLELAPVEIDGATYDVEHAKVELYSLEFEDHGLFTVRLQFSGPSWGQGLNAHTLDTYDETRKRRVGTAFGCDYLMECVGRLGTPGKTGQAVVVLRSDRFGTIDGFATVAADGTVGEPFIPKTLSALHFTERRAA